MDVSQRLQKLEEKVEENNAGIKENSSGIRENRELIKENSSGIRENRELIKENSAGIRENRELITENRELITENRELITENRELITENRELIKGNTVRLERLEKGQGRLEKQLADYFEFFKAYFDAHQEENRRYWGVLLEQTRSEQSIQGEGIKTNRENTQKNSENLKKIREKFADHETRIRRLEAG